MSLIHEALKKAEKEKRTMGDGKVSQPVILQRQRKNNKRFFSLVALLILSVGVFVYFRFYQKPKSILLPEPNGSIPSPEQKTPEAIKKRALQLYKENQMEESLTLWKSLNLLIPTDPEIYNNMGVVLKKMGKKEEAYKAYQNALALKEDYAEALNNLGVLYLSDGQKEKAKINFEKATSLSSNYADPYFNLAILLEQEGENPRAYLSYQKFLELSPTLEASLKMKIEEKMTRLNQQ